jgi:hypothetical protein
LGEWENTLQLIWGIEENRQEIIGVGFLIAIGSGEGKKKAQ